MNADDVLAVIQSELSFSSVEWSDEGPPPADRSHNGRTVNLRAIYPLLKLARGRWLRIAPCSSGSYHEQARKHGMEVTARHEKGEPVLYLRAPEIKS